nr:F-box/LRR-repeat protein At3g48880 [Tanacetum cinerariifolium]
MEEDPNTRKWEDLDNDILVKIFQTFNIFELTSGIGQVYSSWRFAACDPIKWRTLDLSMMESNLIRIALEPYVYVDGRSDKLLTKVLKNALSLSHGNILTLIFHFNFMCPRLKRLVLPAWNRIKRPEIYKAITTWKDLESLTMPSISKPFYIMEGISKNYDVM